MSSSDDRDVLLNLFRVTNGPSWKVSDGWNTSLSLSSWHGVSVDEDGRVVKLELDDNGLKGFIPNCLGKLSNLVYLNLAWNQLHGGIPKSLGNLSNLTSVNLSYNKFSGEIPEFWGPNLRFLSVAWNQLGGAIPKTFGDLLNLTSVNLSYNNISGAIPESVGQLSNLTSLSLGRNQLSGGIPKSLGKMFKLTSFDVHCNKLSDISYETARRFQRLPLSTINLKNNPWTNPPADVVDGGFESIVGYWDAILHSGVMDSWKVKVVLVGAAQAGKTSLAKGMIHGTPKLCQEKRAEGLDEIVGEPCKPDPKRELELFFFDFAGHPGYCSTDQVFLSEGALHLLVVDLKRFCEEPSARGELVDMWLDALQYCVPGSSILVAATQIDRVTGDLDGKLRDLRSTIENHPRILKRDELDQTLRSSLSSSMERSLIFHGVEPVSSARSESLVNLRETLSNLVKSERDMFPSVGRRIPVSWAQVSAMLDAKRSGKDPILKCSRVGAVEQGQEHLVSGLGIKYLHRKDAKNEWSRVIRALKLKRRKREDDFENAVKQLVREGAVIDRHEVLHLGPTLIEGLMRTLIDHDLADVTKDHFWENEAQKFSKGSNEVYFDLMKIHDNLRVTGVLTVKYLRFLWRDVPEIDDKALFESLLNTLADHGVIFPYGIGLDDSARYFMPLYLPLKVLETDLKFAMLLESSNFRTELVYQVDRADILLPFLGALMARFLSHEGFRPYKCWIRGVAFSLREVLVLLHLDMPSHGEGAEIRVNAYSERFVSSLTAVMATVEDDITSVLSEHFNYISFRVKKGYPMDHDVNVDSIRGVFARVDGFEAHQDRELPYLLEGLHQLEDNLHDVARRVRITFARLNKLQLKTLLCPSLFILRPAAAVVSSGQKRSLWATVEGFGRRSKHNYVDSMAMVPAREMYLWWAMMDGLTRRSNLYKDLRLCLLCPYDFSEVPCGLDGNGYPFTLSRQWVTTILPALQVTAVFVKVAIKASSGLDLPVPEFLNGAKSSLEGLADRVLDDGAIEQVLDGITVPGEGGQVQMLVCKAYEELMQFIEEHQSKDMKRYVHFDKLMQLVDDGEGGKVWVSNDNVQRWQDARLS